MSTNTVDAKPTPQQLLINATADLASDTVTQLELDGDDRKAMAASLQVQLEAHIDGRVTRHPDTFQQQLKIIEHGVRRAAAPSLLAHLESIVVEGPPKGRNAAGISAGSAGSKAPLYVPGLDLADEIRRTCRTNTSRITGNPVPLRSANGPLEALVRAYATAALTGGQGEILAALKALQGWAKAIRNLMDPPVIQEVMEPCGNCGFRDLSIRVRAKASTMKCRNCAVRIKPSDMFESAAYLRDMTSEELEQAVETEYAELASVPAKSPEGQALTLAEFAAYCEEHGHLPPSNSRDLREKQLAKWGARKAKAVTNTLESAETRRAVQALQEQYPSKREANRLAKTEMSEAA